MGSKKGIDSNILIYLHKYDLHKRRIANEVMNKWHPVVSSLVFSEYLWNQERLFRETHPPGTPLDAAAKAEILRVCAYYLLHSPLRLVNIETLLYAEELLGHYKLQLRDTVIVASMIEAGCDTLYTEDMGDGDMIDGRLTIKNPFKMLEFHPPRGH
jgi:predicted nucleic acid-binding protein